MVAIPHIYHLLPAIMMNGALPSKCSQSLSLGQNSTRQNCKESQKFHFDTETGFCMNFQYSGCGGNENRFDSFAECAASCLKYNYKGCPFQRNPVIPLRCSRHKDCNRQSGNGNALYCTQRGICCESKDLKELRSVFSVSCPSGKEKIEFTYKSTMRLRIGKTCASGHCPKGATCHQGTYFAYCCRQPKI